MEKAVILVSHHSLFSSPFDPRHKLTCRRPKEFAPIVYSDEEESDSNVGKMPPSDSEDED